MKGAWWSLIALAVAPAFFGLAAGLQEVDAAQYADVSRRMLESGEWFYLRDMNGPFVNKPPMMFWGQALSMALFGFTNLAARLPTLFFGALALAGTFWFGRTIKDARFGAIATAFVGSSVAFHAMIVDPKVDMPLMAFTTLTIAATVAARTNSRMMWAAWVFAGLAMLSKGPIGVVLPMLAAGPEVMRAGFRNLRLGRGLLILAVIVSPFYFVLASRAGPEALHFMLWRQNVGRIDGSSGFRDTSTPFFFLHTSLWAFLPFVPLSIANLVRRAIGLWRTKSLPMSVERIPVWWLLLPLILISSSANKLPQYLYWSTPAAALLAADEVLRISERWVSAFRAIAALACVGIALMLHFVFPGSFAWVGLAVLLPLAFSRVRRERLAFSIVASLTAALIVLKAHALPALLSYQPYEAIGALLRREEPNQRVLPVCAMAPPFALGFYAQRDPRYMSPTELREAVDQTGSRLVVLGPDLLPEHAFKEVGLRLEPVGPYPSYPVSRVKGRFLSMASRESTLKTITVVRVTAAP